VLNYTNLLARIGCMGSERPKLARASSSCRDSTASSPKCAAVSKAKTLRKLANRRQGRRRSRGARDLRFLQGDVCPLFHPGPGEQRTEHVNSQQNKIIKVFSVLAVVLLPPTLIASIYGMSFAHIPELRWR